MIPDYDKVSGYYDELAGLVFGKKLELAKTRHLARLKQADRVLVVGGGTGSLLTYIDGLGHGCHVDFVDISQAMISKAKKQKLKNIIVEYHQCNILKHHLIDGYDVVITNFFFDQFDEQACLKYISHIKRLCRKKAFWLYADFVLSPRIPDRVTKYLMYNFFRHAVNLGKVQLIDHKTLFLQLGLVPVESTSISSFIVSEVYQTD